MSLEDAPYRAGTAADDRQVLITPRFNLAWSPSAVEAGGPEALTDFQMAFGGMLSYLRAEKESDSSVDRTEALLAFSTIMNVDGSSVSYNDRNTRYTNMGGTLMAEPIEPGLPTDAEVPMGGIPNPLNYRELQDHRPSM